MARRTRVGGRAAAWTLLALLLASAVAGTQQQQEPQQSQQLQGSQQQQQQEQRQYGARDGAREGCVPGPRGTCSTPGASAAGAPRRESLTRVLGERARAVTAARAAQAERERALREAYSARVERSGDDGQLRIARPGVPPEVLASAGKRDWSAPDAADMSADALAAHLAAVGSAADGPADTAEFSREAEKSVSYAEMHAGVRGYEVPNEQHRRLLRDVAVDAVGTITDAELSSSLLGCMMCEGVTAALQVEVSAPARPCAHPQMLSSVLDRTLTPAHGRRAPPQAYKQMRARPDGASMRADARYEVVSSDIAWSNACLSLQDYVVLAGGDAEGAGGFAVRHMEEHQEVRVSAGGRAGATVR